MSKGFGVDWSGVVGLLFEVIVREFGGILKVCSFFNGGSLVFFGDGLVSVTGFGRVVAGSYGGVG